MYIRICAYVYVHTYIALQKEPRKSVHIHVHGCSVKTKETDFVTICYYLTFE